MSHRRLFGLPCAAVLLLLAVTGSAAADVSSTTLPLQGYGRMLVDAAHGHVFITGGASDSTILVWNVDGSAAGSITGESGARGMALNGSTLYVARCGWGVIDVIDTGTLTRTGSIPASVDGACDLAYAGGALWYANSNGHLVSVTLDSAHKTTASTARVDGPLATTPAHPDWLVGVDSEAFVNLYDVSDPSAPKLRDEVFAPNNGDAINDIAITPNGGDLLVASGAPYELQVLSLPALTDAGIYPTAPYPNAAAVSPDGVLYAAGKDAVYSTDVLVFDRGDPAIQSSWDFGGTSDVLYPRGLAFADNTHLFAVSKGASGTDVVLTVLPTVTLPQGALSLNTSTQTLLAGGALTVTAHLGTPSANRTVSIYRQPVNGTRSPVTTGTVDADGNLSVTLHPTATTAYTAVWDGDFSYADTTSPVVTANVRPVVHARALGGYRTTYRVRLYHYARSCAGPRHTGCPAFLTGSTPLLPGHTVNVVVQARTSGTWRTILTGSRRTDSTGRLNVIIHYNGRAVIGVRQRLRFAYPKDAAHLGNTSTWVRFRVTG